MKDEKIEKSIVWNMTKEMRKIKINKWFKKLNRAINCLYWTTVVLLSLTVLTSIIIRHENVKNLPIGTTRRVDNLLPGKSYIMNSDLIDKSSNNKIATYEIKIDVSEDGSINNEYVDGILYDPITETISCRVYICGNPKDAEQLKQARIIQVKIDNILMKCIYVFIVLLFIGLFKIIKRDIKKYEARNAF